METVKEILIWIGAIASAFILIGSVWAAIDHVIESKLKDRYNLERERARIDFKIEFEKNMCPNCKYNTVGK